MGKLRKLKKNVPPSNVKGGHKSILRAAGVLPSNKILPGGSVVGGSGGGGAIGGGGVGISASSSSSSSGDINYARSTYGQAMRIVDGFFADTDYEMIWITAVTACHPCMIVDMRVPTRYVVQFFVLYCNLLLCIAICNYILQFRQIYIYVCVYLKQLPHQRRQIQQCAMYLRMSH